jgi:hypothetical protein
MKMFVQIFEMTRFFQVVVNYISFMYAAYIIMRVCKRTGSNVRDLKIQFHKCIILPFYNVSSLLFQVRIHVLGESIAYSV